MNWARLNLNVTQWLDFRTRLPTSWFEGTKFLKPCRILKAEAPVVSKVRLCGIYGWQSGTGTGFFLSVLRFYHVNIIPALFHIHSHDLGDKQCGRSSTETGVLPDTNMR